jgi:hypothetical protein
VKVSQIILRRLKHQLACNQDPLYCHFRNRQKAEIAATRSKRKKRRLRGRHFQEMLKHIEDVMY